jgi:RNA polymerase sigma-70 factor (ECF subfamily)
MAPAPTDAGASFFEANYERIFRYVRGMVRDDDEAEDLTQEAFLRAHRERETVKDPGAMVSWVYRIATHVALDRLRQRASVAAHGATVDVAVADPPDLVAPTLDLGVEQAEMSACVQRFLVDMPDTYRSAILLHDVHGLSGPEIAEVLDVPLPTVKIRLHRARLRLKESLEGGCHFSCDDRGVLVCEPKQ